MARIAGVNLPQNKRIEIGLTYIYGIGRSRAVEVLAAAAIDADTKVRELTEDEVARLRDLIDRDYTVEGDLRREKQQAIKRLQEIGSYRGVRHRLNLPLRGQRTRTNARTQKGPKRTVSRGKKAK